MHPFLLRVILLALILKGLTPVAWGGELSELEPTAAPALSLPDLSERKRSLADFAGQVVVVNFWASWCTPCLEEMPSLRRLSAELEHQPFAVLAVNVGEGERRVRATAERLELDFPILLDSDGSVFQTWNNTVLPSAYVLDREGRLRYRVQGPLEWDRLDIVNTLNELSGERPPAR